MYGLATYLVAAEGLDIRVNNTRKRDLIAKKAMSFFNATLTFYRL